MSILIHRGLSRGTLRVPWRRLRCSGVFSRRLPLRSANANYATFEMRGSSENASLLDAFSGSEGCPCECEPRSDRTTRFVRARRMMDAFSGHSWKHLMVKARQSLQAYAYVLEAESRCLATAAICSAVSGPCRSVPATPSTCSTVRKPGIGIVRLLRARIQPSAPCT